MSEDELKLMPASFDTVGDILIFNFFPEELKSKEIEIGNLIILNLKHINIVAKKTGKYSGEYRIPEIEIICGESRVTTMHVENGVRLFVNIKDAYFSTRTSTERARIASCVTPGENILVMFSGIGPLPLVLSKNSDAKKILGVELNPIGHECAKKSLTLNKKIKNVEFINGDVSKILPKLNETFDRILMPLPKNAEEFLKYALPIVNIGGIIHLYNFLDFENETEFRTKILDICKSCGFDCKIEDIIKCGQYSPNEYRVSCELRVISNN